MTGHSLSLFTLDHQDHIIFENEDFGCWMAWCKSPSAMSLWIMKWWPTFLYWPIAMPGICWLSGGGTTLYRVKYHVRDFTYDVNKENIFHTKILLKEIYLQHCTSHTEPKEFREEEPNVITGLLWREIREIYSPHNIQVILSNFTFRYRFSTQVLWQKLFITTDDKL